MLLVATMLLIIHFAFFLDADAAQDSGWGFAELIEHDDLGPASYPDIGMDSNGNAIAVWNQYDGVVSQIVANRYIKGIGWGYAEFLTTGGATSLSPRIAMNGRGNASIVWRISEGINYNIAARNYDPYRGWDPATIIETNDGDTSHPQVVINEHGTVFAVWSQIVGSISNIYCNIYDPQFGWGTAKLIEYDDTGSAYFPSIAVSDNGEAIAVWNHWDGTRSNIRANRYTPLTGWGNAELIEAGSPDAYEPVIAIDSSGNAVAVWWQAEGGFQSAWANRYTVGSGWGEAELIEDMDGTVQPPMNVVLDEEGNAIAVWHQWDVSQYRLISNRYTPDSGWGKAQKIYHGTYSSYSPHIDMDPFGNVHLVWRQYDGTVYSIFSMLYERGIGWGEAVMIETRTGYAHVPRIGVDPSGDAIAVWYQNDGYRSNIWSNRYVMPDTTPPVLVVDHPSDELEIDSPTVIISGTTEPGAKLTINGLVADVASDGSFSARIALDKGENVLRIISTDASGNHAVETRTVTYTDPLVDEIASLTDAINDLSSSLSSIMENISNIEEEIASIKEMLGTMNTSDNTSSIVDELEALSMDLDMAKENLTLLKQRLSAIEGEGNETVDLSGILDLIDALEYDMDRNEAEISTLKNDVSSQAADIDSLKGSDPEDDEDLKDDVASLKAIVAILGATLFVAILMGILLFIIMMIMIVRRKGHRIEE